MNAKLALVALTAAAALSGCYYVPYGYAYPAYPGYPVVSSASTQREVPVGQASANVDATQGSAQTYATAQPPAPAPTVVYAPSYPAYYPPYPPPYPVYPAYAPYPAYYGYGGPSISLGFGWYGGGGGHHHH